MDDGHPRLVAESPQRLGRASDADLDGTFRVERTVLHRHLERPAVMVLVSEQLRSGIAVGIEVDEAEGLAMGAGEGAHDRQGDGVVAAGGEGNDAGRRNSVVVAFDVRDRLVQAVHALDEDIPEVGGFREIVGAHTGLMVHHAHQRRLIAQMPWAVAGAGTIGHTAVERDPHDSDVDAVPSGRLFAQRASHERGDARVTRLVSLAECPLALVGHIGTVTIVAAHRVTPRRGGRSARCIVSTRRGKPRRMSRDGAARRNGRRTKPALSGTCRQDDVPHEPSMRWSRPRPFVPKPTRGVP